MGHIQKRRQARQARPPADTKELERALRRQMDMAAGTEFFQHRDPLYHVTESFQQTFDAMGVKHARAAAGFGEESAGEERQPVPAPERGEESPLDPVSARSFYRPGDGQDRDMLLRFSETAFQRGKMSAAVLRGTGKMMLFSCLKKTVGQSQPVKEQQRKLFEKASQTRNVPGHAPDKAVFNRAFAGSAVGLVVDTLRDARRTLEDLQDLARGGLNRTEAGSYGADTLRAMYPFLDDSREREMLARYYAQMNGPEAPDAGEKALLQNAAARTRALIGKKKQMREEFINKLRFLSDRATEALAEFEQPGFTEALNGALEKFYNYDGGAEEPPGGGEGGDDDGAAEPGPDGTDPGDGPEPSVPEAPES